ncbi:MAG: MBL fold metallo-hydrolase [Deltaproteobacteria bacterium]|nr:MBL fold metallo-hydrolase [Deltaproteobacteria bacterium]
MKKYIYLLLFTLLLPSCMGSTNSDVFSSRAAGENNSSNSSASSSAAVTEKLKITILNVGQGDATFIESPEGKTLLIDGGKPGKGREVLLPFFKSKNISQPDLLLETHYDNDHIGAIPELIAGEDGVLNSSDDFIPKEGVWDRGAYPIDSAPAFGPYLDAVQNFRHSLMLGQKINLGNSLEISIISLNGAVSEDSFVDLLSEGFYEKENSSCVGLLIRYKNFSYLSAGDLSGGGSPGGFETLDVESLLAEQMQGVSALHANHHGSSTSSNDLYIQTLKPKVVLFNVGNFNDYHHPDQSVLERWKQSGAALYLTEKGAGGFVAGEQIVDGNIELETDGEKMWVNGEECLF